MPNILTNYKTNIFIFSLSLIISACSSREITYDATGVSFEGNGYLNIDIWNLNDGVSYESEQALQDALHNILYFGVVSNNNFVAQKPLLLTEENRTNFKRIENEFFEDDGDWTKFVRMSPTHTGNIQNINSTDVIVYRVSVSKDLLRKYLEEQKIITPITKGF